jgi:putative colanic acid biosynthesis acetyltransferase WcaF
MTDPVTGNKGGDVHILDAGENNPWERGPSFTLENRLYRQLWKLTWALLARWTPPPLNGWRRCVLRLFGARIAPTAVIYPSVAIWSPANLEMDEWACVGPKVQIYSMAQIRLGAYSLVSQGAHLCAGTHDIEDVSLQLQARPIVIGARAWIAAEAFVGPGVQVGEGAVLGARGCTFRHLESWTVYAGNPARPIKKRSVRFARLRPNVRHHQP